MSDRLPCLAKPAGDCVDIELQSQEQWIEFRASVRISDRACRIAPIHEEGPLLGVKSSQWLVPESDCAVQARPPLREVTTKEIGEVSTSQIKLGPDPSQ